MTSDGDPAIATEAQVTPPTENEVAHAAVKPVGPSRWTRLGSTVLTGERLALGATLGLWLGDAVYLAVKRGGATWSQWALGIGAALFVSMTTCLALGALLAPVFIPILRQWAAAVSVWWRALRAGGVEARLGLAGDTLALITVLPCWAFLSYRTALAVLYGFSRPETMAAGMTVTVAALACVLVVAWHWGRRATRAVVGAASHVRGLRSLVSRMWTTPAIVLAALFAGGVVAAVKSRDMLSALPWHEVLPVPGLILGLSVAGYLAQAGPLPRRIGLTLTIVAFGGGIAAAVLLRPESSTAQNLGFDRALSGRIGYAAWTEAFDFDRDGQLSMLGGGDCAPFDKTRYTGAPDRPGDGIDQDCDGVDLPFQSLRPRPRQQVGQANLPNHPTVVLITVDALGAPRLQSLGSPVSLMPHLDDLASRSHLFTHCFAQGPSTRLSFPAMFTSRWDSQLTFEYSPRLPNSFAPADKQLQEALDDAGYETWAVIPNVYFEPSHWESVTRGFEHIDTSSLRAGKANAPQVTDAALKILAEPHDRPLYLWVHYYDAHPPYQPLPGVVYPGKDDRDREYYDAELTYLDRELGRLLAALDQRAEPTYVIASADHSTAFHPHPETRHFHYGYDLYTATLHVPLMVHGPGIKPGRSEDVVSTMDIAPTITDLLRVPDRGKFEGTSLAPELLAGQGDPKRTTFHEYYLSESLFRGNADPLEIVSVRTDKYNLVLNRVHGNYELYDWNADYFEEHNLYETMSRSPEVRRLRSLLGSFLEQFDKPTLPPPTAEPSLIRPGTVEP